ncbi:MAG: HIT family protein [Bacteroidia bacterium]|nr:HIT family protein [Bacteroidia bacterium]
MPSIFSKIISGEIPCHKVAETDQFLAFLDIFPLVKGHTLVIPKQEIDYIFDMPPALLSDLMLFAQKIAPAIQRACPCKRIGVAVIGLEVPHVHIHLIPLQNVADMNFERPKLTVSSQELTEIATSIQKYLL